jgi:hypothetical protein
MSQHHETLADGDGKCSVPMWRHGVPAGFCDKPAYGEQPPSETFRNASSGEVLRLDGRYSGYVPGLACPGHGGPDENEPRAKP